MKICPTGSSWEQPSHAFSELRKKMQNSKQHTSAVTRYGKTVTFIIKWGPRNAYRGYGGRVLPGSRWWGGVPGVWARGVVLFWLSSAIQVIERTSIHWLEVWRYSRRTDVRQQVEGEHAEKWWLTVGIGFDDTIKKMSASDANIKVKNNKTTYQLSENIIQIKFVSYLHCLDYPAGAVIESWAATCKTACTTALSYGLWRGSNDWPLE